MAGLGYHVAAGEHPRTRGATPVGEPFSASGTGTHPGVP